TRSKRDWSSDVCSSDLCFVHLHILAYFHTTPAQNALIRIIPIKCAEIDFIRLGHKWTRLLLESEFSYRIVNFTAAVVIITYRAVHFMVLQNRIEPFFLCLFQIGRASCRDIVDLLLECGFM